MARQLTYREYYADYWILSNCANTKSLADGFSSGFSVSQVDWERMPKGNLSYQVDSMTGKCTFTLSNVPLKNHSVISLTGETSANPAALFSNLQIATDRNADGTWDSFNFGIDSNYDGALDRFINTGNTQNSMFNADRLFQSLFKGGQLGSGFWQDYTDWSTMQLVTNNLHSFIPDYVIPDLSPIGAFYESKSAAFDNAASISAKTLRILDSAGYAVSANQLAARDANADGKLNGAELDNLKAWQGLDEDGVANGVGELTSLSLALARAGLNSVRAGDYAFYTEGNGNYRNAAENIVSAPTRRRYESVAPVAAWSNFALLRNTDNRFDIDADYWIDWSADMIKISSDQRSMVGTDGADSFDIDYYAAYNGQYFNLSLVQDFHAGGGDDFVGGSERSDSIWGGVGNDRLLGYAADDRIYGEEGNDTLEGNAGNDTLDGADVLSGGDGQGAGQPCNENPERHRHRPDHCDRV